MKPNDRKRLVELITALAAGFGKEADSPMFLAYELGLEDLPMQDIERGVRAAMRQSKFMPTPRDIRDLSGAMFPDTRAALAFEALSKAVIQHGSGKSIDFDDKVLNATVRNLGGWPRVCQLPAEEFDKWLRKDFERVYAGLCQSGISAEQAGYVVGEHEQHNRTMGYLVGNTLRLGNGEDQAWAPVGHVTGLPDHSDQRLRITAKQRPVGRPADLPRVELQRAPTGENAVLR